MDVSFLPAPGDLLSSAGDRLDPAGLRARAATATYILVGESHGNACDHLAEASVISLLSQGATKPANLPVIGLEMANPALNPVLAEFTAGKFPPEELEKRLDWATNWGHPFAKYLPVFRAIGEGRLPVYGLNVPPGIIKRLSKAALDNSPADGKDPLAALSPEDRAQLPRQIIGPAPEQLAFLREIMKSHPQGRSTDDPRQTARFQLIQSVWDSAMAEQAVRARKATNRPVIALAGTAHVEGGLGIARRIAVLDPGAEILLISPWRGDDLDPNDANVRVYCPERFESRMGMTLESRPYGEEFQYVVTEVTRESRADVAGLRPGDVVTYAGRHRVRSLTALHLAGSDAFRNKEPLTLEIRRGRQCLSVDLGPLGVPGSMGKPAPAPTPTSSPTGEAKP
jgi:uncharacterized iron-regulated protein